MQGELADATPEKFVASNTPSTKSSLSLGASSRAHSPPLDISEETIHTPPDPPIENKTVPPKSLFENSVSSNADIDEASSPSSQARPNYYGSTPGRGRKKGSSARKGRSGGPGRGYWGSGHNLFYDVPYDMPSSPANYAATPVQYGTMSPMMGNSPMLGPMASPKTMMSSQTLGGTGFGVTPQGFYNLGHSAMATTATFGSPGMEGGFQQQYGYGNYDASSYQQASNYSTPPPSPLPPPSPRVTSTNSQHPSPPLFVPKTQPTDTVYFDSAGTQISSPSRPATEQVEGLSIPPSVYNSGAAQYSAPHWNIYGSPQQPLHHQTHQHHSPLSPLTQLQQMQHLQARASPPTQISDPGHGYVMPTQFNQSPGYNQFQAKQPASVPPPQMPSGSQFDQFSLEEYSGQNNPKQLHSPPPVAQQRDYAMATFEYPLASLQANNNGFEKYYPGPPIQSVPGPAGLTGPEGCNLFVFHVPSNFTNVDMYYLFQPFGVIVSVRIMTEAGTGRGRGFGFVSFEEPDAAKLAIENLNGCQVGNKRLKVQYKERRGSAERPVTPVFNNSQITCGLDDPQYQDGAIASTTVAPPVASGTRPNSATSSASSSSNSNSTVSGSATKHSNDLSVSPDPSTRSTPDNSPDVSKEELLTEDLKGLSVTESSSPSPPQCKKGGKQESPPTHQDAGQQQNYPLLSRTSTESTFG